MGWALLKTPRHVRPREMVARILEWAVTSCRSLVSSYASGLENRVQFAGSCVLFALLDVNAVMSDAVFKLMVRKSRLRHNPSHACHGICRVVEHHSPHVSRKNRQVSLSSDDL